MKVLFLDTVHPLLEQRLSRAGMACIDATKADPQLGVAQHPDTQGLVLRSRVRIDKNVLDRLPYLRFICRSGAGLENIDLDATSARGIHVYNSPEGNRDAVGEHTLGMLLSLLHKLRMGDLSLRSGHWDREGHRGRELNALTVGIIGFGHMGSALAEKLQGLGCRILACDPHHKDLKLALNGRGSAVDLDTIHREADVVSLHCNLTEETASMVDRDFISRFFRPVIILNTSRGKVVNTEDLLDALDSGQVLAAGLDVFDREASSFEHAGHEDDPVWTRLMAHPLVQVSPHVAGWTQESYRKLSDVLADKVLADFS
jgi:D-3-phosphoglycerate dehydrogenase / 2-oxoglutarate reductase